MALHHLMSPTDPQITKAQIRYFVISKIFAYLE